MSCILRTDLEMNFDLDLDLDRDLDLQDLDFVLLLGRRERMEDA